MVVQLLGREESAVVRKRVSSEVPTASRRWLGLETGLSLPTSHRHDATSHLFLSTSLAIV